MSSVVAAAIDLGTKLIDRVFPDPAQRAAAELELLRLAQSGELAQLAADTDLARGQQEVNKIEAASDSLFKSGWRPAAGWVCVFALAYQMVGRPAVGWVAINWLGWSEPPSLEIETLMTLLFGLLGLGAYRSVEKVNGVAK